MAYISQEDKKKLAPAIKTVLTKYGVKGTIAISGNEILIVNIKSGSLDLIGDYNRKMEEKNNKYPDYSDGYIQFSSFGFNTNFNHFKINDYVIDETVMGFYKELFEAMKGDEWFDKSEPETYYYDTAYYLIVRVGKWDKPYIFKEKV